MASTYEERFRRQDIPPEVLAVSPVSIAPRQGARGLALPLNLIASIVSYVDDVADIARVTRTCRLMYYMTLPQLYKKVTLHSYAELRYVDGRPEGFGSGSPFTMAIGGLTTSNSATLVQDFRVTGSWPEPRLEEYMKGKVPDATMLLAIALRAAVDRMTNLKSFSWDLDIKPLKTVYHGLAARTSLTSLELKFPTSRAPRPIIVMPVMPELRYLRITNIDPLCYPDDMSLLLLHSKKLKDLRLHWSPRMRDEAEPSINLRLYFGKCLEAQYQLPLESLSLQNFFGINTGDLAQICNPETLHSTDLINCFGATAGGTTATVFVDDTWKNIPEGRLFKGLRRSRISDVSEQHARILASFEGLKELYLIGEKAQDQSGHHNGQMNGHSNGHHPGTPDTGSLRSTSSYNPSPGRTVEQANSALLKQYLHVIYAHHGQSIKKLLLHDSWALSGDQISELVSSCPNLEQLGLGLSDDEPSAMRILAPFLKKVKCIRILDNSWLEKARGCDQELQQLLSDDAKEPYLWKIPQSSQLGWSGVGERVFRIGRAVQVPDVDGRLEWKREVWRATLDDVKHIDIWKQDCMEI